MNKGWRLTQEAFDNLLDWLDSDRDQAALTYEQVRLRLIKIFARRGCYEAEDLADETINRVAGKIEQLTLEYDGNPVLYFYGVARFVYHEWLRSLNKKPPPAPIETNVDDEAEYECLDQCLNRLPEENRRLVICYYQENKHAKIENRKQLAQELGIALNALRIRAHRIRLMLQSCIVGCVESSPAN